MLSLVICLCFSRGAEAAADGKPLHSTLTAAQIVDRHVTARGGLQAWRAVQTMSVTGSMDAGSGDSAARTARLARSGRNANGAKAMRADALSAAAKPEAAPQVQLPFILEMKRPNKSRLEIVFAGKTAVQVYDGSSGWKLRPYLNRDDAEPFTAEEAKSEAGKDNMEGPLVDYAAKGTKVELAGMEPVEGHDAYRLRLTKKGGAVQQIWIDAQSFLDVKVEGFPRRMDGKLRTVWVYQRDFRAVQGLMIPFVCETVVDGYPQTHKLTIQSVVLNRGLDDARFTKPQTLVAGMPAPK
jgi:outer membrane lipoprotein-sorting protein